MERMPYLYCPKCGAENPDGIQMCRSCNAVLTGTPTSTAVSSVKTSGWAIAALVCAILTPFTCGITAILAIIFGIIALVKISKSSGILAGKGLAIAGICIPAVWLPVMALLMSILMPALTQARAMAQRVVCSQHLQSLGMSLQLYATDYNGKYPTPEKWCDLLIDYSDASKKSFECPASEEKGQCNYAMNKNIEKVKNSSEVPGNMVLLFETHPGWNQAGGPELLNRKSHQGRGCNILFNDGHVDFIEAEDLNRLQWDVQKNSSDFY
jgi:prepilin-type processing-associated H-X9-DG protein